MNLCSLDLEGTFKFLQKKFPSVTYVQRNYDPRTFSDELIISFTYAPILSIKLNELQYLNGNIFYQVIEERVYDHLNKVISKTNGSIPDHAVKPVKFDMPPGVPLNEAYPNCDPNHKSKVWATIKSDFIKIVDFLFPISFLALYSLVFFLFGFILAYIIIK